MSVTQVVARLAVRIEGHVQGVGFQWWTQAVAQELEIYAGGVAGAMTVFEERLRAGPLSARVDRMVPLVPAVEAPLLRFEIR